MEIIKFDRILSVNSEITGHEGKQLLNPDVSVNKSWLCAKGSEKAIIILKLERAAVITKIDLGNANSAFIELGVGRAADSVDSFQTLVPTSSFMSPNESKAGDNGNQVRFFGTSDFEPSCVGKQWDLIKVVCSQPFNKHISFGLCFIKVHGEALMTPPSMKQKEREDTDIAVGAFFRKKKEPITEGKQLSISERIRLAQKPEALAKHSPLSAASVSAKLSEKQSSSSEGRTRDEDTSDNRKNRLLGLEDDDSPSPKRPKNIEPSEDEGSVKKNRDEERLKQKEKRDEEESKRRKDEERKKRERRDEEDRKKRKDDERRKRDEEETRRKKEEKRKREWEEKKKKNDEKQKNVGAPKKQKPFNRLLEGVTFVLSGYQNPERGTHRSNAMEMGAKYKQDWDRTCTHLVAAYINTPKCNQVKGKGKIVSKDWIEKCYKDRKRYPWRRFALDKNDRQQAESEEEIDVEKTKPATVDPSPSTSYHFGTGKKTSLEPEEDFKKYNLSTDDEGEEASPPSPLPDFFEGMTFYLDDVIADRSVLERYIIAYNGIVCEKLNDDVEYFITSQTGTLLDVLKKTAKNFKAVSPTWIQSVNCNQKFLPASNFFIE